MNISDIPSFLSFGAAAINLIKAVIDFIKGKKKTTDYGKITELKVPHKVKIGEWHKIFAAYTGPASSGFLSMYIQDSSGQPPFWYGDNRSILGRFNDKGEYIETGLLNFEHGSYSSEWNFLANSSLKSGNGKILVGVFEEKDFVDVNGQIIQHRPHITFEVRDIILY